MKIARYHIHRVNLPFRHAFTHALASRTSSESVMLEIVTTNGVHGFGECLPRDYVSGENRDQVCAWLGAALLQLGATEFFSLDDIDQTCARVASQWPANSCTRAALELALLDAFSREHQQPLINLFSMGLPLPAAIAYTATLTMASGPALEQLLTQLQGVPVGNIKLKADRTLPALADNLARVRRHFPHTPLRLDANGDWGAVDTRELLAVLADYRVEAVEQPVLGQDPGGLASWRARLNRQDIQLIVDESVCSPADAQTMIAGGACDCINIKISKVGGLFNALAIYRLASDNGVACQLGANVGESSIATAAGHLFASLAGDLRYHEGAFGTLLLEHDVCAEPLMFGADLCLSAARWNGVCGWGVEVDAALLSRASLSG